VIAALCLSAAPALAADFPSRPSRIIVPYAPGGATDIIARLLATRLNEAWGQPVIVENRAGASGNIALELAARAAPDGHTLLVGNVSTNAINETTFSKTLAIKPSRDLPGVTGLVEIPHLWLVHPSVPAATLKELAEYARKNGGKMIYGSAGIGSYRHLDIANFLKVNRIEMVHSLYKGGGPAIADLLGGQLQLGFANPAGVVALVKAGRLKGMAVTGD
jgi:tripartite-type tricarboxylate transporter receptor subunit TctC